jgi:hypothetical protein
MEEAIAHAARNRLADVASLFRHSKPDVVVPAGVAFAEIIKQVYEGRHDMLLVGSQLRFSESARLNPTLAFLLRKAPVPVWSVDDEHRIGDVLVAIGPEYDSEARALNRTLVELGQAALVRQSGSASSAVRRDDHRLNSYS